MSGGIASHGPEMSDTAQRKVTRSPSAALTNAIPAVRLLTKFHKLWTDENSKFRNKVLKQVQYTLKLAAWYGLDHRRYGKADGGEASKAKVEAFKRAKATYKALSVTRRFMVLLEWWSEAKDCVQAVREGEWFDAVSCAAGTVNTFCDDWVTLGKAGLLAPRHVPHAVVRGAAYFWAVSALMDLWEAWGKATEASRAVEASRRAAASAAASAASSGKSQSARGARLGGTGASHGTDSDGDFDARAPASPEERKAAAEVALRDAERKKTVAWLGVFKLMADCGQALPDAASWEEYPDSADHLSGLMSAILSTAKIWVKAGPA